MQIKREVTIPYEDIQSLFYTTYGYEINVIELCFGDDYCNDSYKRFDLKVSPDEEEEWREYCPDLIKIVKMLRNEGIEEDYILIEICW